MLPSIIISFGLHQRRVESPLACFPGGETEACTFEEEVGLGQVQLVPEGNTRVLHPCAGLKLHAHLQLEGPGQYRVSFLGWTPRHTSPRQATPGSAPLQPVSGPAHLVTGFVVVCCMHARLAQGYRRQPVVHCETARWGAEKVTKGTWEPRSLRPQTQESRPLGPLPQTQAPSPNSYP